MTPFEKELQEMGIIPKQRPQPPKMADRSQVGWKPKTPGEEPPF